MFSAIHYESLIYDGGQDSGKVVGTVSTDLWQRRWLSFLPSRVFVTVTGLDDIEAWVPKVHTPDQLRHFHDILVNTYRQRASILAGRNWPAPLTGAHVDTRVS